MLRRLAAVLVGLVVAGGAIGCSGGKADYGNATQGMFLTSCNPDRDGARDAVCRCAYDRLSKRYSYEEFVDLDKQLAGDPTSVPKEVVSLVTACAVEVTDSSSSSSTSGSSDSQSS
ncbi:MAG: hypothetical protein ABIV94_07360 [Acidimicrobiales bacterium]